MSSSQESDSTDTTATTECSVAPSDGNEEFDAAVLNAATLAFPTKACKNRNETVASINALFYGPRPQSCNVYGGGPILLSDVPAKARTEPVVMGIDEAGRGPSLGPMTYGAAFWAPSDKEAIPKGFEDSKALSPETRARLFANIKETAEIGFVLRVLHASEISRKSLQPDPCSLNVMSHDAAIQMVQAVLDAGVRIETCYVDTVGIPDSYRAKLDRVFAGHNIHFVVEKKADAKYAPCSAASVVAKVSRDTMIEAWKFSEPGFEPEDGLNYGSGYPSDPKCTSWMAKNMFDPVFGYTDFARFCWKPVKNALAKEAVQVDWEADVDDEGDDNDLSKQTSMSSFVVGKKTAGVGGSSKAQFLPVRKKARLAYFNKLGLTAVTTVVHS